METETTTESGTVDTDNGGEGSETKSDTVSIPKADYDKLNQTLGSLKRELKDLRKPKEDTKETPDKNQKPNENRLVEKLEKMALRQAGVIHPDDVELAQNTAKKWGVDIDDVLADEDFKMKLERQQTNRTNIEATSGIKGGAGKSQAKSTPEYWIAKGVPPTAADVPDRKTRATIARAMMATAKTNKTFYND